MKIALVKHLSLLLIVFAFTPTLALSTEETRYIHIIVALADNESQGIVPVPKLIGDGNDPQNNLYWGALYGFKTQFKKNKSWQLIKTIKSPAIDILERVIFYSKEYNTYLIGDAYKGTSIKKATEQFLISSSSHQSEPILFKGEVIKTYGDADLVGYVGHNGLMDFEIDEDIVPSSNAGKDSIILACQSKQYFSNWLDRTGSKAVLLTTGNMAPEAYTLEAAIEAWLNGKPSVEIKASAAKAYSKYQKTGIKGATRLFFNESDNNL